MRRFPQNRRVTRRQFLTRTAAATALIGAGAVVQHNRAAPVADRQETNPFAYDVSRLSKTDPKLIHYQLAGRFPSPHQDARRLVVGPEDHVYLAAGNYVSVLDRDGVMLSEIALAAPARCLTVSAEADLYVGLRDHIEVFDRKGQRRATWGSPGPRTWLTGLSLWKDSVFLADAGNRVVLCCDRSGKVLGRIGEKNKDRNVPGFIVPSPFFDLEMHPDGLLRVTNPGRHRIEAYTLEGDLEFAWGKPSASIEGFCGCCNPINLALLPNGHTVTCEKGLPRVKVYRADGTFDSVVAGPESFPDNAKVSQGDGLSDGSHGGLDAAVDAQGRIYVLDLVKGDVRVMTRKADAPEPSRDGTRPAA